MKKHLTFNNFVLFLVGLIAIFAFILSFKTISALGEVFFPSFGWLFAIMVDLTMIVLGLVRVQAGKMRDSSIKSWALLGLVLTGLVSIVMNVVTGKGVFVSGWLHYLAHGLPPVALLALSELALTMYDASRDEGGDEPDSVMARALIIVSKLRRQLSSKKQELVKTKTSLDESLARVVKMKQILADTESRLDAAERQLGEMGEELDKVRTNYFKLESSISREYVPLDKLPPRVAYIAGEFSMGRVPNGDFADKFGVGHSSVDKTMRVLHPMSERN